MDLTEVSKSLPALLNAYTVVLEQVDNEPLIHIHRRPVSKSGGHSAKESRLPGWSALKRFLSFLLLPLWPLRFWWWGFSIRPIVKLFAEAHMNAKAAEIGRFLRMSRLRMTSESRDEINQLDELIRLVGFAENVTTGLSRLLVPLRFAPALVMLLSWAVIGLTPDVRDLSRTIIYLVLAYIPLLILLLYPLVVRFGFRWKRAFFTAYPSSPDRSVDSTQPLEGQASPNIYELENRLYKDMGFKKSSEMPIDLIFHPAPYWLLTTIVGTIIPLTYQQARGNFETAGVLIIVLTEVALVIVFLVPTWRAIDRYRRRRAGGLA